MNNSAILLYNFQDEKLKMTKMVCMMLKIRFKEINRSEYNQPLGALLGLPDIKNEVEPYFGEELSEEMLLLHGFDGSKLQKFLTALKAMLTENNKTWSGLALYEELCRERDEFKKMAAERGNKNSEK